MLMYIAGNLCGGYDVKDGAHERKSRWCRKLALGTSALALTIKYFLPEP